MIKDHVRASELYYRLELECLSLILPIGTVRVNPYDAILPPSQPHADPTPTKTPNLDDQLGFRQRAPPSPIANSGDRLDVG